MTRRSSSHACDRARAHISARLDGELSELEEARLGSHLARCAACQAYDDQVRVTTKLLRAAPLEPLDFPVSVARRRRSAVRQFELAAAVVLAAAIGLGSMFSALGTPRSSILFGSSQNARPAYYDSQDYDQRFMKRAPRVKAPARGAGGVVHV
jgi:predicted anti-sigma-YlaC factor YlaD